MSLFFFKKTIMKEKCKIKEEVKLEEVILVEAKNGDSSLVSKSMAEEEDKLLNSRIKEVQETVPEEAARLNESQYTRLDDLLTQTQLYSEFLLEQMDQITTVSSQIPFFFFMNFVWLVVVFLSIYLFICFTYDLNCIARMEWSKRMNLRSKVEVGDQKEKLLHYTIL